MTSLREKLIGAWELVEYAGHLPDDESNKKYPMGPDAKGIIMYTPDGYMSAQLLTPGQPKFEYPGEEKEWAQVGKNYIGYTGQFFVDEEGDEAGPVLMHQMRCAILPGLLGDVQRRLVKIQDESDGRYLILGVQGTMKVHGEDRVVRVRWRRLPDNSSATKPPSSNL